MALNFGIQRICRHLHQRGTVLLLKCLHIYMRFEGPLDRIFTPARFNTNKAVTVPYNVALRRVHVTIVPVEKQ